MQLNHSPKHVLIDFENVPTVNLAPLSSLGVEVTLLAGARNKNFPAPLVAQLMAGQQRSHFIQIAASGRNALDLTLAFYLGKAAAENPRAEFFIISKDKDYEPMIDHVRTHGVRVSAHSSIEDLPFLPKDPKPAPAPVSAYDQFVHHLRKHANNRPTRRTTLLRHITAHFGNKVADPGSEGEKVIARLQHEQRIRIDEKGRITYNF